MTAQWVTMEEACEMLDCCPKSIYNYVKVRRIKKFQAIPSVGRSRGSKPYFKTKDLLKMLPRQSKGRK